MNPKANQIYKHFKGNLYRIITMAKHSETEEDMVVYQALYGEYAVYTRPLASFVEVLDTVVYPAAKQKYRFEPVQEMVEPVIQEEAEETILSDRKQPVTERDDSGTIAHGKESELTAENTAIDPMLEAYLDTDSYREKLNILHGLQHRITEHMLLTMAVVIDFELPEGSVEAKYDALHDCLLTREKYECNRMI